MSCSSAMTEGRAAAGPSPATNTELRMVVAHKGFCWIEVETEGRAAHGSAWEVGIDANLRREVQTVETPPDLLHELPRTIELKGRICP